MKKVKKILLSLVIVLAIIACDGVTLSYANSAQSHWDGVDGNGLAVKEADSPIVVEKELLTFDLQEFPKNYYFDLDDFLSYGGKVTAEYTFYNPSDYTVTSTLAFPFGSQPDYANIYDEQTGDYVSSADTAKYQITAKGKAVETSVRYTLSSQTEFDVQQELQKIKESYIEDEFFLSTTKVTKYTYIVGGARKEGLIDKEKYRAANIAFDLSGGNGKTKIYFPDYSGFHLQKNGDGRFSKWADNGDVVTIYAIGEPLTTPITFKCYKDGGVKNKEEIDGTVSLVDTVTCDFEDFVLENYEATLGISKVDWYNAVVCALQNGGKSNEKFNFIFDDYGLCYGGENFAAKLMRWYEYSLTFAPEEKIVNVVTAPIYPSINLNYQPSVFSYSYLLSPAKTWKNFGGLNIVVNTPYYISNASLQGFVKTDFGYKLTLDGLPNEELTFYLSTSENPVLPSHKRTGCSK